MMALTYDHAGLTALRRWRQWLAPPATRRRALCGRTLGIVGVGHVGGTLARYAQTLGMTLLGWRRRREAMPDGFNRVACAADGERLEAMLTQCEFLVLACPLNDATRGLPGKTQLAALPRGAFVINVARGGVVDEHALLAALRSGHVAGAGLDVFAVEPLPADSPFWSMPQVLLSPHNTPRLDDCGERHLALFEENLRRYVADERLLNQQELDDAIEGVGPEPARLRERCLRTVWRILYRLQRGLRSVH